MINNITSFRKKITNLNTKIHNVQYVNNVLDYELFTVNVDSGYTIEENVLYNFYPTSPTYPYQLSYSVLYRPTTETTPVVDNGLTKTSTYTILYDLTSADTTIPLDNTTFDSLTLTWFTFGECYFSTLSVLIDDSISPHHEFLPSSKIIIDNSLIFNLEVDVFGYNYNSLRNNAILNNYGYNTFYGIPANRNPIGTESNITGGKYVNKIKLATLQYINNIRNGFPVPESIKNITESIKLSDASNSLSPTDTSWEVILVDDMYKNDTMRDIIVIDGSVRYINSTILSYVNKNLPITITCAENSIITNYTLTYNADLKFLNYNGHSPFSVLRYYIDNNYIKLYSKYFNTIFCELDVQAINYNIYKSSSSLYSHENNTGFKNGTFLLFSSLKSSTYLPTKTIDILPTKPDDGNWGGYYGSNL